MAGDLLVRVFLNSQLQDQATLARYSPPTKLINLLLKEIQIENVAEVGTGVRINLENPKVQEERKERDQEVEEGGLTADPEDLEAETDGLLAEVEDQEVEIKTEGPKVEIEGLLLEAGGLKVERKGRVEIGGLKAEKRGQEAEIEGQKVVIEVLTEGLKVVIEVSSGGLKVVTEKDREEIGEAEPEVVRRKRYKDSHQPT